MNKPERVLLIKETPADLEEQMFIRDIKYRSFSFGEREGERGQEEKEGSAGMRVSDDGSRICEFAGRSISRQILRRFPMTH